MSDQVPAPTAPVNTPMPLALPEALLRATPAMAAFWPGCRLTPWDGRGAPDRLALPMGMAAPPGVRELWSFTPGPWRPPRFGARETPVALICAQGSDPIATALAVAAPAQDHTAHLALLAEARLGGPSGLPDPGAAALGMAQAAFAVLLDPCDPGQRDAAERCRRNAVASGLALRIFRDPFAPAAAPPLWPETAGRFDPWTLLDGAARLHGASRAMALLALAAGVELADGPFAGASAPAVFGPLIAATRCVDPFRLKPCSLMTALEILALWRQREGENRRITVCLGVQGWKRERVSALLASSGPPPRFAKHAGQALSIAKRQGGALLVWAPKAAPSLTRRAATQGTQVLFLEDGFLRSVGLGAAFRPGGSFVLDQRAAYYDAAQASDLEALLNHAPLSLDLLARAAELRHTIITQGFTKYNLAGAPPALRAKPGQQRILVPGQVENDASIRRGTAGIRRNRDLLMAVRQAAPDAFIIYKPHPDVAAGFRPGHVPAAALARLSDQVITAGSMHALLGMVDQVHCLTSLTGFEALLRGLPVTVWGSPFYAGWGLTADRGPPFPPERRLRQLSIDGLVAACLILYPRCLDPVTQLPCPPEVLLERLAQPELWPLGRHARLRALQGWLMRGMARLLRWQ